jgi:transcriptional regulator with XRE-family HTH domain
VKGFGDRLKEAREICKLTQRELAIMCDTDEAIIRGYEKERRAPSKSMMLRLFDALKTPPDFFFQDELSFNPYQDKDMLFSDISKLSPAQYKLLRGFVDNLKAQD